MQLILSKEIFNFDDLVCENVPQNGLRHSIGSPSYSARDGGVYAARPLYDTVIDTELYLQ